MTVNRLRQPATDRIGHDGHQLDASPDATTAQRRPPRGRPWASCCSRRRESGGGRRLGSQAERGWPSLRRIHQRSGPTPSTRDCTTPWVSGCRSGGSRPTRSRSGRKRPTPQRTMARPSPPTTSGSTHQDRAKATASTGSTRPGSVVAIRNHGRDPPTIFGPLAAS